MRPISLKVRGAKGFKNHLNGDIDLDFTQIGSGLVAVVAPNGTGKTTLLELLTPYNEFPSHRGAFARGFYKPDSLKDFTFEFNGKIYRIKSVIDGEKGTASTFLYENGGEEPLNPDGKNFDALAERVFGSKEVFYNSVFMKQPTILSDQRGVIGMKNAPAKEFFFKLMPGFERYPLVVEHASRRKDEIENEMIGIRAEKETLERQFKANREQIAEKQSVIDNIADGQKLIDEKQLQIENKQLELKNLEQIAAERDSLQSQVDKLGEETTDLKVEKSQLERRRDELIAELRTSLENCRLDISNLEGLLQSEGDIRGLLSKIDDCRREIESLAAEKKNLGVRREDISKSIAEIKAAEADLHSQQQIELQEIARKRSELDKKVERTNKLLENADTIRVNASRFEELKKLITEFDKQKSDSVLLDTKKTNLTTRIEAHVKQADKEIKVLEDQIIASERLAAQIETVPCKDTQEFVSTCPLIKNAYEARGNIADLRARLSECESNREPVDLRKELQAIEAQISELGYDRAEHDECRAELSELEQNNWAEYKSELEKAEELQNERSAQREELNELEQKIRADFTSRIQAETDKLAAKRSELEELLKSENEIDAKSDTIRDRIKSHRASLYQLPPVVSDDNLWQFVDHGQWNEIISLLDKAGEKLGARRELQIDLKKRIEQAATEFRERISKLSDRIGAKSDDLKTLQIKLEKFAGSLQQDLATLKADVKRLAEDQAERTEGLGRLRGRLETIEKLEAENKELSAQLSEIEKAIGSRTRDIAEYTLIERAYGRDEIPAMKLEAIAPEISSMATEILQGFGIDWIIDIKTTKLDSKGKRELETFNIMVNRGGVEDNCADLSGGQQVWVELALRNAIAIHVVNSSGMNYQTMFRDESDGPLDVERARAFLDVARSTHNLTGAYYTFLITQRPDIYEQVEQRIILNSSTGNAEIEAA